MLRHEVDVVPPIEPPFLNQEFLSGAIKQFQANPSHLPPSPSASRSSAPVKTRASRKRPLIIHSGILDTVHQEGENQSPSLVDLLGSGVRKM